MILSENPESANSKEIETLLIKSIKIFRGVYGGKHRFIADHLASLGIYYTKQKKYTLALQNILESIAIYDELNRPMYGKVIEAWQCLARIYSQQNNKDLELSTYKTLLNRLKSEKADNKKLISEITKTIKTL